MGIDYLKQLKEEQDEEERKKQETKEQKDRLRQERLGITNDVGLNFRTPQKSLNQQTTGSQPFAVPAKPSSTPQSLSKKNSSSQFVTPTQASKTTKQASRTLERTPTPRPFRVQNKGSNKLDKQEKSTSATEQKVQHI